MSDVFVVLEAKCAEKLDDAVRELKKLGMHVTATDPNDGVVEGTIPTDKLVQLKQWDCVADVRIDFTYIAQDQV
jgi:hypothetical protein